MKNSSRPRPKPPADLSAEAKKLWKQLIDDFEIDDRAGFLLLSIAMRAFDEAKKCEEIIRTDGLVITDRFGQKRQHPATLCLRDSRNTMLRAIKQLNLDIAPGEALR